MVLPSTSTFEVHELLPKLDCGLCGNPICMTFARKILLEAQKPEDCSFVSKGNLEKIKGGLAEKRPSRKHPHPNLGQDIIEIHPCTEDGKVTLETQLRARAKKNDIYSDLFDQYHMCSSLSETEMFEKVNCSPKMGYALVEIKGKRAHIFKTGKIIMRRADNREDALKTLMKISKVLLPARICSCSNILVDCFAGCCDDCTDEECSALLDHLVVTESGNEGNTVIADVLGANDTEPDLKLMDNFKALREIVNEIRKIDDVLRNGNLDNRKWYSDKIDEIVSGVNRCCMENILKNRGIKNTIIALTQYGLGRDLIRARGGFLSLNIESNDGLFERAKELFFDAYGAFEGRDINGSRAISERYRKIISDWDANSSTVGTVKIATNGFYISRILGKPVPQLSTKKNVMKI